MSYGHKLMITVLLLGVCSPAFAHEKRTVGENEWSVGFVNEPAFSGQMNGVDLQVRKNTGEPVTGLQYTLNAKVFYGDDQEGLEVPFRVHANHPWNFEAYFLPVRPGNYRFRIYGTVSGKDVDEVFQSGNGFEGVEDAVQWRVPAAVKNDKDKKTPVEDLKK